ncbi:hypothetical protein [Oceanobacillus jeddahense]|uniref:Lipoprotein n=1 Tax=Oceanobacillus jeddahense TaxID=1462527 RepID=A0ABY5JU09_9BACI|nr:hypothetical protein [Oceanobacillus jeddahense]UUI03659.1 hypothetical protein NP439_02885 [Oceanobacillus jeddahense]
MSLLLLLGACQSEDATSQAETNVPHQKQESDEEAISGNKITENNKKNQQKIR